MRVKIIVTILYLIFFHLPFAQDEIIWDPAVDVSPMNMYDNERPRIALDGSGNPMVLWGSSIDNFAYFSRWSGSSFTTPTPINSGFAIFSASWAGPDMASKGDTVYIVLKRMPETTQPAYIYSSFDGGMTFSSPVVLDGFISDSISRFPTATVDDSGNPVVAFMKINPDFSNARWVVTTSTDYGMTMSPDVLASDWSGGDVCDCCPSAITISGNDVAMMYRDNNSNIRDMWCGISNTGGTTFNNGYALESPNWMLMACPSSGPDGVIIGDSLYSVMMNGASGDYLVYFSKSSVSSLTTTSVTPLTGTFSGLNNQNYPRIASDGNAVAVVWKQDVVGGDQLPILFTNNIYAGFPSIPDTIDYNNIVNVDIAMINGIIHVVWEDSFSGTVKYRKGAYGTVGLDEDVSTEAFLVNIYPNPATSFVEINTETAGTETMLTIFAADGRIVNTLAINGTTKVNTSTMPSGLYFFSFKNETGTVVKEVIVN